MVIEAKTNSGDGSHGHNTRHKSTIRPSFAATMNMRRETSILTTLSRDRENVETFRVNSENKLWEANHRPWDGLDSGFLSTHARAISGTGRVHSTSPAQISTHIPQ